MFFYYLLCFHIFLSFCNVSDGLPCSWRPCTQNWLNDNDQSDQLLGSTVHCWNHVLSNNWTNNCSILRESRICIWFRSFQQEPHGDENHERQQKGYRLFCSRGHFSCIFSTRLRNTLPFFCCFISCNSVQLNETISWLANIHSFLLSPCQPQFTPTIPIGSTGLVYLPTFGYNVYGKCRKTYQSHGNPIGSACFPFHHGNQRFAPGALPKRSSQLHRLAILESTIGVALEFSTRILDLEWKSWKLLLYVPSYRTLMQNTECEKFTWKDYFFWKRRLCLVWSTFLVSQNKFGDIITSPVIIFGEKNTSVLWHLHMFWGRTRQKFGPTPSPSSQWAHKASQSWQCCWNALEANSCKWIWTKKSWITDKICLFPGSYWHSKKKNHRNNHTVSKMTQQNLYNCTIPLRF